MSPRISNEKVSNIIVNDPNFNKTLFYVDLPKGTRVFDTVSGLRYIVGESMSEKPDGVSKNLNEVAMDTLEDMAEQNVQIEIFIPQSGIALEKDESFVLSLSDGKLINPKKMPESEESHKFLTKLGRGDIAWDDKLVAVRGAKVLTTKQQASKPLKSTKGKWSISYELPDKAELPYSILVVTKENQTYLMNITKIENNGIRITYRKLNPDEINLYKPEAANN